MNTVSPAGSSESFAALFEESLARKEMRVGEVITAEVIRVDANHIVVNAGLKSESYIPTEEFHNDRGEIDVKPGDFVQVAIDALEDGFGETRLSRDKAKRLAAWMDLEQALEKGTLVQGSGQRQGQRRPHRDGERHTRLPARLAGRHPAGERHHAVSKTR